MNLVNIVSIACPYCGKKWGEYELPQEADSVQKAIRASQTFAKGHKGLKLHIGKTHKKEHAVRDLEIESSAIEQWKLV